MEGIPLYNILLDQFGIHLADKKRDSNTIEQYKAHVKIILPEETYKELSEKEIKTKKEYRRTLGEKIIGRIKSRDDWKSSRSNSTIRGRISATIAFLEFLGLEDKIEEVSYFKAFRPITSEKRKLPTPITNKEFEKFLEIIPINNYYNARDRATFCLMFYSGFLSSEIVNLKYEDIIKEDRKVYIKVGKGIKRRKLKIDKRTVKEIRTYKRLYLNTSPTQFPSLEEGYFFKNSYGERISTRSIRRKFKEWASKAGLKANPRILRGNYARKQLFRRGKSPEKLAEQMGLSSKYAHRLETLVKT